MKKITTFARLHACCFWLAPASILSWIWLYNTYQYQSIEVIRFVLTSLVTILLVSLRTSRIAARALTIIITWFSPPLGLFFATALSRKYHKSVGYRVGYKGQLIPLHETYNVKHFAIRLASSATIIFLTAFSSILFLLIFTPITDCAESGIAAESYEYDHTYDYYSDSYYSDSSYSSENQKIQWGEIALGVLSIASEIAVQQRNSTLDTQYDTINIYNYDVRTYDYNVHNELNIKDSVFLYDDSW